jgi:hypothetical protein
MQNRKAIILSLGMLMQRVDLSRFIDMMQLFGQMEHDDFVLTPEIMGKGAALSNQFNIGQIEAEKFAEAIMQLLNLTKLTTETFWQSWNNMIQVGQIDEKLKLLQSTAHLTHASFYLYSVTNAPHLKFIAQQSGYAVTHPTTDKGLPATFNNMPLYASCLLKQQALDLIKQTVADIRQKQHNIPDEIILLLANPENIENPALQAQAKKQNATITTWCEANKVKVVIHDFNLRETLFNVAANDILTMVKSSPRLI